MCITCYYLIVINYTVVSTVYTVIDSIISSISTNIIIRVGNHCSGKPLKHQQPLPWNFGPVKLPRPRKQTRGRRIGSVGGWSLGYGRVGSYPFLIINKRPCYTSRIKRQGWSNMIKDYCWLLSILPFLLNLTTGGVITVIYQAYLSPIMVIDHLSTISFTIIPLLSISPFIIPYKVNHSFYHDSASCCVTSPQTGPAAVIHDCRLQFSRSLELGITIMVDWRTLVGAWSSLVGGVF